MNTHQKESAKTVRRIAPIATALSVMLLAACSVPVQVSVQTKPQQPPAFIDELKQKLPNPAQPGSVAPQLKPLEGARIELPAAAPASVPEVVWPARGAGDFESAAAAPASVPEVVWPARGAGDFEAATAAPPIYWYTVGVDERELNPPAAVPVIVPVAPQKAGEDLHDRHPGLLNVASAAPQKAGEDLHDRHPRVNLGADEELRMRLLYTSGPRVNVRPAEPLKGSPEPRASGAKADIDDQKDVMWYRHPSRNER